VVVDLAVEVEELIGEHLAELHALLIKRVDVPQEALEAYLVLVQRQQRTYTQLPTKMHAYQYHALKFLFVLAYAHICINTHTQRNTPTYTQMRYLFRCEAEACNEAERQRREKREERGEKRKVRYP
jgi:hypothetical protein